MIPAAVTALSPQVPGLHPAGTRQGEASQHPADGVQTLRGQTQTEVGLRWAGVEDGNKKRKSDSGSSLQGELRAQPQQVQ